MNPTDWCITNITNYNTSNSQKCWIGGFKSKSDWIGATQKHPPKRIIIF